MFAADLSRLFKNSLLDPVTAPPSLRRFLKGPNYDHTTPSEEYRLEPAAKMGRLALMGSNQGRINVKKRASRRKKNDRLALAAATKSKKKPAKSAPKAS